ncbi:MAG: glycosyltransferase family 2 protein, partial [Alphaproteobacteria bacterium]|nr:glycosyltransferase family 2 protein [Alphaproteobacteria bacterium]
VATTPILPMKDERDFLTEEIGHCASPLARSKFGQGNVCLGDYRTGHIMAEQNALSPHAWKCEPMKKNGPSDNNSSGRISVAICAYNAAKFINDSLASIINQTFGDIEIIVIDDGSTDGTDFVLSGFTDPRLNVVRNPSNLGVATSRNISIALARGEFIALLDADDIAHPDRLATQHAFMAAHPEVTICGSDMRLFGAVSGMTDVPADDSVIKANFLSGDHNIMNPTSFMRRDFIANNNIRYNPNLQPADDLEFWIQCMRYGANFANLKLETVFYRVHDHNISKTIEKKWQMRHNRQNLFFDLFPSMTASGIRALAALFYNNIEISQLDKMKEAHNKAIIDMASVFGEDRKIVSELIKKRFERVENLILQVRRESP